MYETVYGKKYEATKNLSRVELAKLIREDIKAAVKAGELPKAKYSVTCQSYAGGGSINVKISDVDPTVGFVLHNPARLRWDLENPNGGHWNCPANVRDLYSPMAVEAKKTVERIVGAYNYDGSDIQTDYFNVRFYSNINFAWQWAKAQKEAQLAALRTPQDALPTVFAPSAVLEGAEPANANVETAQAAWLRELGIEA